MTTFDTRGLEPLAGTGYDECLRQISVRTQVRHYLEVGVATGSTMSRVGCQHAIGVDPNFILNANVAKRKGRVSLFQLASDDYFEGIDTKEVFGGTADLVFLDGMHLFEFLLRDFFNAEAVCSPDSIIAMHDCLPRNALMAHRDFDATRDAAADTPYAGWWTGDVWKVIPILRKYRPDLTVTLVDAPPTGLVLVTGLDPRSTNLKHHYDEIVSEYTNLPNDFDAIERFNRDEKIVSTTHAVETLKSKDFAR